MALLIFLTLASATAAGRGETLYNGITLPSPWPPTEEFSDASQAAPAYLKSPFRRDVDSP